MSLPNPAATADVAATATAFARWRDTTPVGARIPEALWSRAVDLARTHGVGEQAKYLAFSQGRPLACLGFTSAPRHLGPRDRFIGWSPAVRRAHVHELAHNTRFLILPWVRAPHLASHLLGAVARRIAADWENLYGHAVHYLETFVDPERF